MIAARFPDRASADPVIELLEGTGYVLEQVRREGVQIEIADDGSVTIMLRGDDDAHLIDLLRRAGGNVQKVHD